MPPLVSIAVPMFNEAEHVAGLLHDIAAQDYAGDLQVIIADGGSTDRSAALVAEAAGHHGLDVEVIANPARWVPHGLNACIRRARGGLIVRMDCHARYPPDYVRRLLAAADETGAWNVGGVIVPEGRTRTERAVACAMDGPFGGIGWSRHGMGAARVDVDTVTYGAFRPKAFAVAGMFDESLVRNEDEELNLRLGRAGGRIVLDPSIRLRYTPRSTYGGVARQYYAYGLWKVPVMRLHRRVVTVRSLAPVLLVLSLVALLAASAAAPLARAVLAAEIIVYGAAALTFATISLRRRGEPASLLPRVLASYPAFHLSYGAGMTSGLFRALSSRSAA